jgi:multiple sugar transport system permease protein
VTRPETEGSTPALTARQGGGPGVASSLGRARSRYSLLTRRDKIVLGLMVGIPLLLDLALIWGPAVASFVLSFTKWRGVEPLTEKSFIGLQNYEQLFTGTYPFFWPAVQHNIAWLGSLMFVATPLGILMAVLLDRKLRGSRIYQTIFYLPVVLSLAVIGIIWQLQYSADNGFIDVALRGLGVKNPPDWFGDQSIVLVAPLNLWAAMVAASWRHVGYVMILYLAGLKSVDPALREAAKVDGATERQTFLHVVFPVMAPINVVIVVITTIEALRAFDLAYIVNRGRNGLELLSTLITNNSISESSRVGFGSAIAVVLLVISLGPILVFLIRTMRMDER